MTTINEIIHSPILSALADYRELIVGASKIAAMKQREITETRRAARGKIKDALLHNAEYVAKLKARAALQTAAKRLSDEYVTFVYDSKTDGWDYRDLDENVEKELAPSVRDLGQKAMMLTKDIEKIEEMIEEAAIDKSLLSTYNTLCDNIKRMEDKYDAAFKSFLEDCGGNEALVQPVVEKILSVHGEHPFVRVSIETEDGKPRIIISGAFSCNLVVENIPVEITETPQEFADWICEKTMIDRVAHLQSALSGIFDLKMWDFKFNLVEGDAEPTETIRESGVPVGFTKHVFQRFTITMKP